MAGFAGRFHDGEIGRPRPVVAEVSTGGSGTGFLFVRDAASGGDVARWACAELYSIPSDRSSLRLGSVNASPAARLVVEGRDAVAALTAALPALGRFHQRNRARQVRFLVVGTAALGVAILAFVFGVPLIARQVVALVPPQWEAELGARAAGQVEAIFSGGGALARCDTGPRSPANQAIARFVKRTLAGAATPFEVNVDVVRSDIANAFALPGGHVYYFSALIEESPDGDAFAGVLAHEIGHVVNRHGLENAIATAGSGLVVGMLLGDVTGFSVGAILGQALINSRFSREAEHAADLFAIETARRVGFDVHALGAVLRQIAADTGESRVLSLLSSHPLTEERAVLLDASPVTGAHAFTPAEWRAIATMC